MIYHWKGIFVQNQNMLIKYAKYELLAIKNQVMTLNLSKR